MAIFEQTFQDESQPSKLKSGPKKSGFYRNKHSSSSLQDIIPKKIKSEIDENVINAFANNEATAKQYQPDSFTDGGEAQNKPVISISTFTKDQFKRVQSSDAKKKQVRTDSILDRK